MGLFYTNLAIYRPERQALIEVLRQLGRTAFVSPTFDGYTIVFDQAIEDQDDRQIDWLGKAITRRLTCSGLAAMLHDDDVLYLRLFQQGKLTDCYDSLPQYFDPVAKAGPPEGGNSELICGAFERTKHCDRVEVLLRADLLNGKLPPVRSDFDRHRALAVELGMPIFVAGVCYSSIAGDYVPEEFLPGEYKGLSFEAVREA